MAIDTREKRASIPGVGRPWMRGKLPGTVDAEWRLASGLAYAGNTVGAPIIGANRLLLINPPGVDGGFGTGWSL